MVLSVFSYVLPLIHLRNEDVTDIAVVRLFKVCCSENFQIPDENIVELIPQCGRISTFVKYMLEDISVYLLSLLTW